jgi:CDGSH-type Zn-finger protein
MSKKEASPAPHAAPRVKVSKNGPYLVSGAVPLTQVVAVPNAEGEPCEWRTVKEYPLRQNYALCRCGESKARPFCDGTHTEAHFDGTETAGRERYLDRAKEIEGPALNLTDARDLCIGASFCTRAGGTWDLTRQSGDPTARSTAIEEAGNCPSGRLVAWDKEGKAIEPIFKPSIAVIGDPEGGISGALWARGCIPVESADGTVYGIVSPSVGVVGAATSPFATGATGRDS